MFFLLARLARELLCEIETTSSWVACCSNTEIVGDRDSKKQYLAC